MSEEFKPITTQEELDKIIQDRLTREKAKYADYETLKANAEKWKDYETIKSELDTAKRTIQTNNDAYGKLKAASDEKDTKIARYETDALRTKVAISKKIPLDMLEFLQGATEEELNSSAEKLLKFSAGGGEPGPLAHPEGDPPDSDAALYFEMAKALKK